MYPIMNRSYPFKDYTQLLDKIQYSYAQELKTFHIRFWDQMIPVLWQAAVRYGIDPLGMVAQSMKETNRGNFTGRVKPEFYNTCGLKVQNKEMIKSLIPTTDDDHPLVHQVFPNWSVGAEAHAQHLRVYTGTYLASDTLIVDPRFFLVSYEPICEFSSLGGKWAPSLTYGIEIEKIIDRIRIL